MDQASNIFRYEVEDYVEKESRRSHRFYKVLSDIRSRIRTGEYNQEIVNAIVQGPIDLADVWSFSQIYTWLTTGRLGLRKILVGHEPLKDSAVLENNERLQSLPLGFSAEFWGGRCAEFDGTLRWTAPPDLFFGCPCDRCPSEMKREPAVGPHMALEVGSTQATTTWRHLVTSAQVARWPYGSRHIWLIGLARSAVEQLRPDLTQPLPDLVDVLS